jgi:hypothetical protein
LRKDVMARFLRVTSLALTVVVLAGCGGGDDRVKVEASLRQYLANLVPQDSPFPIGAGIPRVKHNGCKDRHLKFERAQLSPPGWSGKFKKGERFALWSCVVRFGTLAMPVLVAVDDRTEVGFAGSGEFKDFKLKSGGAG